jgi:hypothetical protein
MVMDWGPGTPARNSGLAEVRKLVGHGPLDETRIPVVATATDLLSASVSCSAPRPPTTRSTPPCWLWM